MQQLQHDFGRLVEGVTTIDLWSPSYLDPNDACYAERQAMADQSEFFDTRHVGNAIVLGIVAGVVAGLITRDAETGLKVGAIAAGVSLAASYLSSLQSKGLNANQISERVSADIDAENAKIDALVDAFDAVDKCRKQEARVIQADYEAKRIDRARAEELMAGVRARWDEDVAKFQQIAEQIDSNSRNYAAIYNEIAADNGRRGLVVQEPNRAVERPKKAKKSAGTAEGSLAGAKSGNMQRLERDCLRNVRKRDGFFKRVDRAKNESAEIALDVS